VYIQNVVPFSATPVFEQARRDNLLVDVDLEHLYRTDAMYITNYDRFFIKPYALTLEDLRAFRRRCDGWTNRRKMPKTPMDIEEPAEPGAKKS